jgi:exodeoxyribonuclease VII small subunit
MAAKKLTFEQAIGRLDEIVKALESGEGSLDQAMKLFEEGSKLADTCSAMLDDAEQKVTKLIAVGSDEEVPFEAED